MIDANSRYAKCAVRMITGSDGVPRPTILLNPPAPRTFQFQYYVVADGDRIDAIANRFLGDSTFWYVIADANPEVLTWDDLQPGTILRIPNGLA